MLYNRDYVSNRRNVPSVFLPSILIEILIFSVMYMLMKRSDKITFRHCLS